MGNLKAWLGQVTTGHGFMVLAPTLMAALTGQMTWQTATPLLVGGTVGLIWPENTTLRAAAQGIAQEAVSMAGQAGRTLPLLAVCVPMVALTACSAPTTQKIEAALCVGDTIARPIALKMVNDDLSQMPAETANLVQTGTALDATLVHPMIADACAKLQGTLVGGAPAAK